MSVSVVVFDLGGTLMEYKGMHLSWVSYYKDSFDYVNKTLALGLTDSQIETSIEIFTNYNPRIKPREVEIAPETIFADITSGWNTSIPVKQIIDTFFESLHLEPVIYDDSIPALKNFVNLDTKPPHLRTLQPACPMNSTKTMSLPCSHILTCTCLHFHAATKNQTSRASKTLHNILTLIPNA